jgi:hypothetical protein
MKGFCKRTKGVMEFREQRREGVLAVLHVDSSFQTPGKFGRIVSETLMETIDLLRAGLIFKV